MVQKWTTRPFDSSVFSGGQSPMSNWCDTIRVPGFSSAHHRGCRFTFNSGSSYNVTPLAFRISGMSSTTSGGVGTSRNMPGARGYAPAMVM